MTQYWDFLATLHCYVFKIIIQKIFDFVFIIIPILQFYNEK